MINIKIQSDEVMAQATEQAQVMTPKEPGKPTIQTQAVNTAILNASKQILLQGINQYGDLTGNYSVSRSISEMMSIGSDILIAASSPIGAIAVGSKYLISITDSFIKQKREIENIDILRQRSGFISSQGSRY